MEVKIVKHTLRFLKPAITSRNILTEKPVYYIILRNKISDNFVGIGECSVIPGLSIDDLPDYELKINTLVKQTLEGDRLSKKALEDYPSIQFGIETALVDLRTGGRRLLFESDFTTGAEGIPINGLIWMGDKKEMVAQIEEKLNSGFTCLKLKIGSIHFEDELDILRAIRELFNENDLEIRLDANGAFHPNEALKKLNQLYEFGIHSIEQPIMPGLLDELAELCKISPIPIALDEELIGIKGSENKNQLLKYVKPAYLILKPSLIGGFNNTNEWIELATEHGVQWWITSALESNIGLNAIAQFTYTLGVDIPQGLGTGLLYSNNIPSPLFIGQNKLWFNKTNRWNFTYLKTS